LRSLSEEMRVGAEAICLNNGQIASFVTLLAMNCVKNQI